MPSIYMTEEQAREVRDFLGRLLYGCGLIQLHDDLDKQLAAAPGPQGRTTGRGTAAGKKLASTAPAARPTTSHTDEQPELPTKDLFGNEAEPTPPEDPDDRTNDEIFIGDDGKPLRRTAEIPAPAPPPAAADSSRISNRQWTSILNAGIGKGMPGVDGVEAFIKQKFGKRTRDLAPAEFDRALESVVQWGKTG